MSSTRGITRTGFFGGSAPLKASSQDSSSPTFTDVGGMGACGFRSLVAILFEQSLKDPRKCAKSLELFLSHHYQYYPNHRMLLPPLATTADRLQQMMMSINPAELLEAAAYTLRQIAVTEMCAHPDEYPSAFVEHNEGTSPATMRQSKTWVDEAALVAAANVLSIGLEVHVVTSSKSLPMRLRYNVTGKEPFTAVLRLKSGHYEPCLENGERFSQTRGPSARALIPQVVEQDEPNLAEICTKIKAADERVLNDYQDHYQRLLSMVAAQELSKESLIDLYILGMKSSDYLQGRIAVIAKDRGDDTFFDVIHQRQLPSDDLVHELIHALARAMSIGHMNPEQVFAGIDEPPVPGLSRR